MRTFLIVVIVGSAILFGGVAEAREYLDPSDLEIGAVYITAKKTPINEHHSPADPMKAIGNMKYMPEGFTFKVLDRYYKDGKYLWYKVGICDSGTDNCAKGWVNKNALYGVQPVESAPEQAQLLRNFDYELECGSYNWPESWTMKQLTDYLKRCDM